MRGSPRPRLPVMLALTACLATAAMVSAGDVADDVAVAFRDSSARAVRAFLPREGRVYVALSVLDVEEGFVGSDQLYYLLDALFKRAKTAAFEVTSADGRDADTVFLHSIWRIDDGDGRERKIRLSITLSRDKGAWAIRELRGGRG